MGDRSIVERLRSALLYEGWGGESELPELAVGRIEELEAAALDAKAEIDRLREEVRAYREAARYDPMMDGSSRFSGWNLSALHRARSISERARAALNGGE